MEGVGMLNAVTDPPPATNDRGARRFEEMLSALGHDLRSPLGAAHLNIEAALRRLPSAGSLATEIRVPLQRASEIVKQTVALMEELLVEARDVVARELDARDPAPEEAQFLDLGDIIHDCVVLHSTALQAARCPLTVHCTGDLAGTWPRGAIHQILSNLIVNATKYAPGKPIDVHASRDNKKLILGVSDQGPGFSQQEQGRVFERFRREPRAGRPEGFGLGLWIVRRAVERLGGTVRLISAPGEGALFLIELPVVE